jgi:thiamine-phosphate pyrophosphorylase
LPEIIKIKSVNRIIDANINRAKEGLRVCEEITRFVLNSRSLTSDFKIVRHEIDFISRHFCSLDLLEERSSSKDVGSTIYANELRRKDLQDIFFANIQRVKESIRVLEEFSKLDSPGLAVKTKRLRYRIYDIEKKSAKRISSLRSLR